MYTTIQYVTGVLSDVLNYLLLHAKETAEVGGGGNGGVEKGELVKSKSFEYAKTAKGFSYSSEGVFVACFQFLKALAKSNIEVQRRCVTVAMCLCGCMRNCTAAYM